MKVYIYRSQKMKKLLAIAVTAALTVPMTSTVFAAQHGKVMGQSTKAYGSIRYLLSLDDDKTLGDYGSRIGLKGSNGIDNGLTMTHKIELGIKPQAHSSTNFVRQRSSYIGIKGGFGEVRIGSDWSPLDNLGDGADVLQNGNFGKVDGDINHSIKYLGKFGSVGVLASVIPKGNQNNTKAQLAALYSAGPIFAGVGFGSNVGENTNMVTLAYKGANYKVGLSTADDGSDDRLTSIMGKYSFGKAWVAAQLDDQGDNDAKHVDIGYKLGKGTKVFLQLKKANDDDATKAIGLRHDF